MISTRRTIIPAMLRTANIIGSGPYGLAAATTLAGAPIHASPTVMGGGG